MKMWAKLAVFVLALSVFTFAQHGRGGAGMGGGNGMGNTGGMGNSNPSMDRGSGHSTGAPNGSLETHSASKQTPDTILSRNTKLSSNLDKLLPAGTTAQQACSGFKNLGQCVAAIHVSHNLGIPFADLKAKVTGSSSESLGKAIHDLKPDADAKAEAKKGQKQADRDLNEADS